MLQNAWIRLFIWIMAIFFFFLMSMVLISMWKPGPSEMEVMKFIQGTMIAMEKSLMGISMSIETDPVLTQRIIFSAQLIIPCMILGAIAGLIIRIFRRNNERGKKN